MEAEGDAMRQVDRDDRPQGGGVEDAQVATARRGVIDERISTPSSSAAHAVGGDVAGIASGKEVCIG